MNEKKAFYLSLIIVFLITWSNLQAQDFVYEPINPAFGGNTFNYQWLLSSAQAQNTISEQREEIDYYSRDPLQEFEESLNRQILSQLSREIIRNQFGEDGLEAGLYEFGNYQIDVSPGDAGVVIKIIDVATGSETTVTVPYF